MPLCGKNARHAMASEISALLFHGTLGSLGFMGVSSDWMFNWSLVGASARCMGLAELGVMRNLRRILFC